MLWNLRRGVFTALLFFTVTGCGAAKDGTKDGTNVTGNGAGTSGSLDTTFGTGGKVTLEDFTIYTNYGDSARALVIQSDGKIVVAGNGNAYFALARYNTDGSLDSTFGTGGKTAMGVGSGAYALGIQSDGKMVVAGWANNGSNNNDFAVVRFNADGYYDSTFGTGGKVITTDIGIYSGGNFVSSNDFAYALGIQSDGKIVVAGYSRYGSTPADFALVRYNADGSLDTTFGTGGKVTTDIAGGEDWANALGIQSNGKIVVAGWANNGSNNSDVALVRYNTDGSLDSTFGTGGKVTTAIGSSTDSAFALGIQSDGKIVATGYSYNGLNADFALVRYNADGTLDSTFGTGGKVTTAIGNSNDFANALGIQSDGKIVAAGISYNGLNADFSLVRYNADGSLDLTFGTGGKVITVIGNNDSANALGIQSDGKIVVAGHANNVNNYNNWDFAVVRYLP